MQERHKKIQEDAIIGMILKSLEEFCHLKPKIDIGFGYEFEEYKRLVQVEGNLISVLEKKIPWTKEFFDVALKEKDYSKCLEMIEEKRTSL